MNKTIVNDEIALRIKNNIRYYNVSQAYLQNLAKDIYNNNISNEEAKWAMDSFVSYMKLIIDLNQDFLNLKENLDSKVNI